MQKKQEKRETWAYRVGMRLYASHDPLEMADLLVDFGLGINKAGMLHTVLRRMQTYGVVSVGKETKRKTCGRKRLSFQLTDSGRKWVERRKAWMEK